MKIKIYGIAILPVVLCGCQIWPFTIGRRC